MKATELRIGNWISDRNMFEMEVSAVFKDEVYLDFEGNEGDVWEVSEGDLQPIPLTEEWLLKFGFKQCENYYWYRKGNVFTNMMVANLCDTEDEEGFFVPNINTVHSLQNLYFALTGEELTIKN